MNNIVGAENIIKEFLICPHNQKRFNNFHGFCYNFTVGYLHYLKRINYQLPYDDRTDKDPIRDLAIDILGFFLACKEGKPYYIIFDYFARQGINDFKSQSGELLYDQFSILIKGFIKKRLFKLKNSTNPQIENLKRRFKDILRDSGEFESLTIDGTEFIFLKSAGEYLREDKPPISYEELENVVLQAFNESNNNRQWCMNIFRIIGTLSEYKNMVSKYLLLTAIVKIISEYVDEGEFITLQGNTTTDALINSAIKSAFDNALNYLETKVLSTYLKKQAITSDEKELLYGACRNYLIDYCTHGGDTDPIPVYFREMMPLETHERYLKDYKNIFESLIKKMLGYFKDEIINNPTFRHIRNYY